MWQCGVEVCDFKWRRGFLYRGGEGGGGVGCKNNEWWPSLCGEREREGIRSQTKGGGEVVAWVGASKVGDRVR